MTKTEEAKKIRFGWDCGVTRDQMEMATCFINDFVRQSKTSPGLVKCAEALATLLAEVQARQAARERVNAVDEDKERRYAEFLEFMDRRFREGLSRDDT